MRRAAVQERPRALQRFDNTARRQCPPDPQARIAPILGQPVDDQHLIAVETGEKAPTARLIFVESAPPYRWRVVQLDVDYVMLADQKIDEALAELAECKRTDTWNDREDLHLVASPPSWLNDDENEDDE